MRIECNVMEYLQSMRHRRNTWLFTTVFYQNRYMPCRVDIQATFSRLSSRVQSWCTQWSRSPPVRCHPWADLQWPAARGTKTSTRSRCGGPRCPEPLGIHLLHGGTHPAVESWCLRYKWQRIYHCHRPAMHACHDTCNSNQTFSAWKRRQQGDWEPMHCQYHRWALWHTSRTFCNISMLELISPVFRTILPFGSLCESPSWNLPTICQLSPSL